MGGYIYVMMETGKKRISLLLKADKRCHYDRPHLPKPRSVTFPTRRISAAKCPRQNTIITPNLSIGIYI